MLLQSLQLEMINESQTYSQFVGVLNKVGYCQYIIMFFK